MIAKNKTNNDILNKIKETEDTNILQDSTSTDTNNLSSIYEGIYDNSTVIKALSNIANYVNEQIDRTIVPVKSEVKELKDDVKANSQKLTSIISGATVSGILLGGLLIYFISLLMPVQSSISNINKDISNMNSNIIELKHDVNELITDKKANIIRIDNIEKDLDKKNQTKK